MSYNIAIIGFGFVGQAVHNALNKPTNTLSIIDPAKGYILDKATLLEQDFIFICVPTESGGQLDDQIVEQYIDELAEWRYQGVVVIKSTISLEMSLMIEEYYPNRLKIIVNPEFLTERNAKRDFVDQTQTVIGTTDPDSRDQLFDLYFKHSYVRKVWVVDCTPVEATAYKLFTNVFLAAKVSLFNEFRSIYETMTKKKWNDFAHKLTQDPRIGNTHLYSPGHDGQYGFGGKCLPTCIEYLENFCREQSLVHSTISGAVRTNHILRKDLT